MLIVTSAIIVIRVARESICSILLPRYVFQLIVEVFQEVNVSGNSPIDFLWMSVILQICMVGEDHDWFLDPNQKVSPVMQGRYNSQKLLVPHIVIPLRRH